jgi:hypothetical protein
MITNKESQINFVDDINTKNIFADIIGISINNETARLKIALRNDDNVNVKTTHNIIITLPHFLRLAEALNTASQEVVNQIKIPTDGNTNP